MSHTQENPYTPPTAAPPAAEGLTVFYSFGLIAISAAVCAAIGAALGMMLGMLVPDYYRVVFSAENNPDFVPWKVGLGLGLSQGVVAGAILGAIVVLAVAWSTSRRRTSTD